ncbi:MAG: helix-turn-helix domain-containing protein [Acidobacteriota bacterium]|nr:helix-turn-helix domain-containing protein [Acidobacteriota bacterium]
MQLTKKDVSLAQKGHQALNARPRKSSARKNVRLLVGAGVDEITLPPQAVKALAEVLEHLAEGKEVTIAAHPVEMTTQQVAEFLRVSRPFLIGLLEKGEIPHRKVGTHRRVLFADVAAYKQRADEKRLEALEQLAAQAQELGMGY